LNAIPAKYRNDLMVLARQVNRLAADNRNLETTATNLQSLTTGAMLTLFTDNLTITTENFTISKDTLKFVALNHTDWSTYTPGEPLQILIEIKADLDAELEKSESAMTKLGSLKGGATQGQSALTRYIEKLSQAKSDVLALQSELPTQLQEAIGKVLEAGSGDDFLEKNTDIADIDIRMAAVRIVDKT
jgi:uncharacterized protein YaiE (UPF0345 family)